MGCTEIVLHQDRSVAKGSEFAAHMVREAEIVLVRYAAREGTHSRYVAPAEYHTMMRQAAESDLHTSQQMLSLMLDLEFGSLDC